MIYVVMIKCFRYTYCSAHYQYVNQIFRFNCCHSRFRQSDKGAQYNVIRFFFQIWYRSFLNCLSFGDSLLSPDIRSMSLHRYVSLISTLRVSYLEIILMNSKSCFHSALLFSLSLIFGL
jgi:hypothetical protein